MYAQIWQQFAGDDRVPSELFGQPQRLLDVDLVGALPDLRALAGDGASRIEVPVRMRVTEFGEPRDVELVEPDDPLAREFSNRVLRTVRADLYRPAIIDGEPVEYSGFESTWYAWSQ